jgi:hypothetical protein
MATTPLNIEDIRTDGNTQPRAHINQAKVNEYADLMRDGTAFPAPVVFNDGTDNWLADGFHRVMALGQMGATVIDCEIVPGCRDDAFLYAVGANGQRGLEFNNADKRRVVSTMLGHPTWTAWSDREIGRRAGVSHTFVAKMRAEKNTPATVATAAPVAVPEAPESPATPPPPAPAPTDRRGSVILDEKIAAIFDDGSLEALFHSIDDVVGKVDAMTANPAAAFLRIDQLRTHLKNAKTAVNFAKPYALCPFAPNCKNGCKACNGQGWLPKDRYDVIPAEVRG